MAQSSSMKKKEKAAKKYGENKTFDDILYEEKKLAKKATADMQNVIQGGNKVMGAKYA